MRSAILVSCLLMVVGGLVLQTVLLQMTLRSQIREERIQESESALKRMQNDLSVFLRETSVSMLGIYSENDLISDMRQEARQRREDPFLDFEEVAAGKTVRAKDWSLRKYFWRCWYLAKKRFSVSDRLCAMYLYDSRDALISSYRYNCQSLPRNLYTAQMDVNARALWNYAHSDQTSLWVSGYYNQKEKRHLVRIVLKLHNYDEERLPLGYLVCDLDERDFGDIMKKYVSYENVFLWVQPAMDQVVASIGTLDEKREKVYRQVSKLVQNYYQHMELKQEYQDTYLVHVSLPTYGLESLCLVPQSLMTLAQRSQTKTLLILTLVMSLASGLMVLFLSRWISRPVEQMRDTILRIQNGEASLRIRPDGWAEELTVLGREFNEMLDRISQMVSDEYEYKLLVERTEYKMLQAQINPHFLYNTLNTMSAIANAQDCALVSGLCQSLSAIFRYCLDMSDDLSTLQKELAHCRNYLYVMDVRNPGEVSVEYDLEGDTLSSALPRITLQPIVENALTHGLRNVRRKDKRLRISARHEGEDLVILVEDNGAGFDPGRMQEELARNDSRRVERGVSIGVLNVNARIKKVFGNGYGLTVESRPLEGTRVCIRVPREERKDEREEISGNGGG